MVADIAIPISSTGIAILRKKAEQDHLELTIPDDVLSLHRRAHRSSVRSSKAASSNCCCCVAEEP